MKLKFLALKWAITDKFRDYLLGNDFVVYTDNNPLSYLKTAKLGATELRWASELAQFNFTIKYRSGKLNQNADSLSRIHCQSNSEEILSDISKSVSLQGIVADCQDITKDEEVKESIVLTPTFPEYSMPDLEKLQRDDPNISRVFNWLDTGHKPTSREITKESKKVRKILRKYNLLQVKDGVL
jgi:hypothetical protein